MVKSACTTRGALLEPPVVMGPGFRQDDSGFVVAPANNNNSNTSGSASYAL
jgi:hypothetical protein